MEKVTYRDFICAMTKVLLLISDMGVDPSGYIGISPIGQRKFAYEKACHAQNFLIHTLISLGFYISWKKLASSSQTC